MCLPDITGAVAPGRLSRYEIEAGRSAHRARPGMDKGNNVLMTGMCFIAFQTKATSEGWAGLIRNISPLLELCWEAESQAVGNYSLQKGDEVALNSACTIFGSDLDYEIQQSGVLPPGFALLFISHVSFEPVLTDGTCCRWDSCLDQKQANLSLSLSRC